MTNQETTKAQQIAALNDEFRRSGKGGKLVITAGIMEFDAFQLFQIFDLVKEFSAFGEDNDPHGEHDFGSITFAGEKLFWKIDTFADDSMAWGAEDHTGPKAFRVMTVMLASEY